MLSLFLTFLSIFISLSIFSVLRSLFILSVFSFTFILSEFSFSSIFSVISTYWLNLLFSVSSSISDFVIYILLLSIFSDKLISESSESVFPVFTLSLILSIIVFL